MAPGFHASSAALGTNTAAISSAEQICRTLKFADAIFSLQSLAQLPFYPFLCDNARNCVSSTILTVLTWNPLMKLAYAVNMHLSHEYPDMDL